MEVITHNKYNEDFSLYSPMYQAYYEIVDNITNNVVKEMAVEAGRSYTDQIVNE